MWNDLTMRERADLIRQGVALGYKDIDSIRNNYHVFGSGSTLNSSYQDPNPYYNRLDDKHKKEWRSLAAQRQKFNQMLQQYSPQIYNDPQLRNTMEFIAFNEGRWVRPTNIPKSGATGYFQLTPPTIRTYNQAHNTNYTTKDPAQDFAMMQYTVQTSMDNINKLLKDPTFRRKAQELGWDQYDLLKASWLLGPTGMKNHVLDPKGYNPKDEYGSSASSYVKKNNDDDVMIVNRGPEQPAAILVTPEDVRRKLDEDKVVQGIPGQQSNIEKPEPIVPLDEVVQNAQNQNQDSQSTEDYLNSVIESQQEYIQQLNEIQRRKAKYDFMLQATPVMQKIQEQEKKSSLDILKEHLYKQKEQQLFQQALQNRDTQQRWHALGRYFDFSQPTTSYKDYINPLIEEEQSRPHKFDLAGTINTPYSNNNSTGQQITENQFAVPQYYPQYEWDPEQFYPTTRLGTNNAIYDNIDMTKPYEPIQSYPRVGEVNPIYKNPTVKGEPVEILHRVKDNDNQAVARYQDGELGIVNLPDNYWQRYLPEVVIPGRMQQLQGVIDKAQEGKGVYDLQQDLDNHLRYMDEKDRAQQDAFYNPRAVLDNASRIPLVGILPTISEYAYGMLKGGPEGQYWKDRAEGAANEQMLPIGLVAANINPVTAAMADSALLGSSLYDIDRNGLNEENGIGLALGMMGPTARGIKIVKNNTLPYNLGNVDIMGDINVKNNIKENSLQEIQRAGISRILDALGKDKMALPPSDITYQGSPINNIHYDNKTIDTQNLTRKANWIDRLAQKSKLYKKVLPTFIKQAKNSKSMVDKGKALRALLNQDLVRTLARYPEIQQRLSMKRYPKISPEEVEKYGKLFEEERQKGPYEGTILDGFDLTRFPESEIRKQFQDARNRKVARENTTSEDQYDKYYSALENWPYLTPGAELLQDKGFIQYPIPKHTLYDASRYGVAVGETLPSPEQELSYNYMMMNLKDREGELGLTEPLEQSSLDDIKKEVHRPTKILIDPEYTLRPRNPDGSLAMDREYSGWYNVPTGQRYIVMRPLRSLNRSTGVHEGVAHATDDDMNLVTRKMLKREYSQLTTPLKQLADSNEITLLSPDSINWWEARATILEVRNKYLEKLGIDPYNVTVKDKKILQEYVDGIDDSKMTQDLESTNTYGEDYAQLLRKSKEACAITRHLITDGFAIGAPIGIASSLSTNSEDGQIQ